MYSAQVLDHFDRPRNMGVLPYANGVGLVGAPAWGDVLRLQLKIAPLDGVDTIVDVRAQVFGCGAAIAEALALPAVKVHCSVLAEEAIQAALSEYRKRKGREGQPQEAARPSA